MSRKLLVFVLSISCVMVGAAERFNDSATAKTNPNRVFRPHPEIPKNCIQTQQADSSVLETCECEQCGHPEERDGMNPLPYSCSEHNGTVSCGYYNEEGQRSGPPRSKI